jgi:hypothetical protein
VDLRFTTKGQCRFFLVKKITIPLRVILVPQSATATCHDQIKIGFKPGLNRYFANTQKRLEKHLFACRSKASSPRTGRPELLIMSKEVCGN